MSVTPPTISPRELLSVLPEDEAEPLLDVFAPPVNKKVESCKEALYSGAVAGAWGLATGLAISALFYANGAAASCVAVGALSATVASVAGGIMGTVAKNVLASSNRDRILRVVVGAYGTTAATLSISNATAWGMSKTLPIWTQFAIGVPSVLAGATACAYPRARIGCVLGGFVTSAGTGCLVGIGLGSALGAAFPDVGQKNGPILGLMGMQAICGYIIATAKSRNQSQ